jgi:hypothetical protein
MEASADRVLLEDVAAQWCDATDELVRLVEGFDGGWDNPSANAGWTNRQLLAHIAKGYVVRLAVLQAITLGRPAQPGIDLEMANRENVARFGARTISEIAAEMIRVRATMSALLELLRPEHLDLRTGLGKGALLRDTLPRLSDHDLAHARELRATP